MSKHLPEKVDNIGQTVGINHEGKGLGQNDDSHIALEAHLGQGSQHTEKVSWTNGPNHHKDKETVKTIALKMCIRDRPQSYTYLDRYYRNLELSYPILVGSKEGQVAPLQRSDLGIPSYRQCGR